MHLKGIAASPGIATGTAVVFTKQTLPVVEGDAGDIEAEVGRLDDAVRTAVNQLVALKEKIRESLGDEFAHIFRSQQTIAEDENIRDEVEAAIRETSVCAETALRSVFDAYRALFDELDDSDYNKSRVADIEDVYKRILRNLLGIPEVSLADLSPDSIIVAEELYPSDTAMMDAEAVGGMVTERGGATSHVAILAKNLGIPAAVRVEGALTRIRDRDSVVIESVENEAARVFVNPDRRTVDELHEKVGKLQRHRERVERFRGKEAVTTDGARIVLSANVGATADLEPAYEAGATSIGLYRSEFLFLNSPTLPDEERQFTAYRRAAERFAGGFVIVRTLDIGGDKHVPSIPLSAEDNPFLGNRALRLCLARPDLFRKQLRAILRAGAHGAVKIMFPMVGGVPELDRALAAFEEAKGELEAQGIPYDRDMEVGIMVEVPSAVWVADALARRVSFFSIGTNDLTQYLMAADRLNGDIEEYYRTFDPSVFRSIRDVASAAERHGRWVGVCGELAGNPLAIPALMGLGVTELSMSARLLAEATWLVRRTSMGEASGLARDVLALDSHTEIKALLRRHHSSKE